jgi:hypothetical protein
MKSSIPTRVLLLFTGLLAAYQVGVGIDGLATLPIIAYTIGFGVLLVATVLLIILGLDVLDSPIVASIASAIPLGLSLGLVSEHLPALRILYLSFVLVGLLAIVMTRLLPVAGWLRMAPLMISHSLAGMAIFLLPVALVWQGRMEPAFALVGLGGALIGIGGILLSFLKAGRPVLKRETIHRILPAILLLMTACFVVGTRYG